MDRPGEAESCPFRERDEREVAGWPPQWVSED
jgi:hypothetical protein